MPERGQLERVRREFAELRKQQDREWARRVNRKTVESIKRQVRATLQRVEKTK